jgi:phosphatidylinositol alpha-1,6-mannosyltransferase
MQRVATELHAALNEHPEVRLSSLVLRTSWKWTPVRTAPFLLGLLARIPHVVQRDRIQVVLFSSMVTAPLALPLRRWMDARRVRMVTINHGQDVTLPNRAYQRLLPRAFQALDLVLPVSRATAAASTARGLPQDRIRVIPNGVDLRRFPPVAHRETERRALLKMLEDTGRRISDAALLLCSVGRHQERKGFHWFVNRVMPRLPADVVYLLGGEGPTTSAVRAAALQHGLEDRVRLLGRVSEETLALLYRGADLFVMPNVAVQGDIEGFGVVMLEAGASGLPIIAADLEGVRDVIEEGENGHLLPSGDADAFAGTIVRYGRNRVEIAAASVTAARFTSRTFGWSTIADRYVEVLRQTVDSPAPLG